MKTQLLHTDTANHLLSFCTTYDAHQPALLEKIIPFVRYLEVTPDTIAKWSDGKAILNPLIVQDLLSVGPHVQILAHGVGLSIGSYDGYSEAYLQLLDQLLEVVPLKWHSEHLGYTSVDGVNLNTMIALPRTQEMLDLLCNRIQAIQDRYALPFLLENIVHILPDYPADYSDAAFLNALTDKTGCGLILDVYNLECDAYNHGFNIDGFITELNLFSVREIHMAGGTIHRGFQLDIHSNLVSQSTIDLTNRILDQTADSVEVITFELLPQAVFQLGEDAVAEEVERLSQIFTP